MPIRAFMGRRTIRSSVAHSTSQSALRDQFNGSLEDVLHNLRLFVDHMHGVSPDILEEALEPTFGKAVERCPVSGGDLRASGYLETKPTANGAEAELGFGRGGMPDYAIYVHEMPYAHEEPTRDKFLQSAIDEDYSTIISRIPQLVREAAGI